VTGNADSGKAFVSFLIFIGADLQALSPWLLRSASFAFIVAGVSMPACCLLIAKNFRRFELFALPVGSLAIARFCATSSSHRSTP
jgi:hypothetical protein